MHRTFRQEDISKSRDLIKKDIPHLCFYERERERERERESVICNSSITIGINILIDWCLTHNIMSAVHAYDCREKDKWNNSNLNNCK
jgi:hypothetical protein